MVFVTVRRCLGAVLFYLVFFLFSKIYLYLCCVCVCCCNDLIETTKTKEKQKSKKRGDESNDNLFLNVLIQHDVCKFRLFNVCKHRFVFIVPFFVCAK